MRNRSWGISEYKPYSVRCLRPCTRRPSKVWRPHGNGSYHLDLNMSQYDLQMVWLCNPWIAGYPISRQTLISVARIQWCSLFGSQNTAEVPGISSDKSPWQVPTGYGGYTPRSHLDEMVVQVPPLENHRFGMILVKTGYPQKLDGQIYPLDIQHSYWTSPSLIQR